MRNEKLAVLAASAAIATGAGGCGLGETLGLEQGPETHMRPDSPECNKVYNFEADEFGTKVESAVRIATRDRDPDPDVLSDIVSDNKDCFWSVDLDYLDLAYQTPEAPMGLAGIMTLDPNEDHSVLKIVDDSQEHLVSLAQHDPLSFADAVILTDRVKQGDISPTRGSELLDVLAGMSDPEESFVPFKNRLHSIVFERAKALARSGEPSKAAAYLRTFPENGVIVSNYNADNAYWLTEEWGDRWVNEGLVPLAIDAYDETVMQHSKKLVGEGASTSEALDQLGLIDGNGDVTRHDFKVAVAEWETIRSAMQQLRSGHTNEAYATLNSHKRWAAFPHYDSAVKKLQAAEAAYAG